MDDKLDLTNLKIGEVVAKLFGENSLGALGLGDYAAVFGEPHPWGQHDEEYILRFIDANTLRFTIIHRANGVYTAVVDFIDSRPTTVLFETTMDTKREVLNRVAQRLLVHRGETRLVWPDPK